MILSADQKVLDWNVAFDLVFNAEETMNRGMAVAQWYERIDNFRRLPNEMQNYTAKAFCR